MPGAEGFKGIEAMQDVPAMPQSIEMPEFDMSEIEAMLDGIE